jgi:predicted nucleotidyltransferase
MSVLRICGALCAISAAAFFVLTAFAQRPVVPTFIDVATRAGIVFRQENGASPEKHLPETMGGGGIFFDYDNDGWLDIFLVNGGSFVDEGVARKATHRLYHNNGNGSFTDQTAASGIRTSGFGMGACSADYDRDGRMDLYVTSMGPSRLYRNTADGRFEDVTERSGAGSALWSTSCAFADIDNDGDADLYVVNYVDYAVNNNKQCIVAEKIRAYCHPNVYNGVSDVLFRNNGDGTFSNITREAGIHNPTGKGLGVVFGDYDRDGWIDIYIANDSTPNFMFHNEGKGRFKEVALILGVAVGPTGEALAGMGTDMGDLDSDGFPEIIVTNLAGQTHSLYKNMGGDIFTDATFQSGVGRATLPFVGFGAVFVDYDNDSDLDLSIVNGDVIDNVAQVRDHQSYPQRNLLLQNDGTGKFTDVSSQSGSGFTLEKVSRALAAGDIDNDGDLDLLVVNVGQSADLLRNEGGNARNSILVRAIGSTANPDAIGAELTLTVNGRKLVRHVKAGSSYLAQNDLRVHFGMGESTAAERLEVRWPGGNVEVLEGIQANRILTVRQGKGVVQSTPYAGK